MVDSGVPSYARRNLYTICLAMVVVTTGFSFIFPFMPLFIQELGIADQEQAAFWSGVLGATTGVSMAIFSPIWGVLSDKLGRKPLLLRAMFGGAGVLAAMAFVTNLWQLLGLRLAQGALSGIISPATALVAAASPRHRLAFSIGLLQMAASAGTAFGPVLGGLVADAVGYRQTFVVGGALLGMAGLAVLLVVKEHFQRPAPRARTSSQRAPESIWRSVFSRRMAPVLTILFFTTAAPVIPFSVLPVYFSSLTHDGQVASASGLGFSILGITGAISAVAAGKLSERFGLRAILVVSCLLGGVAALPQAFVRTIPEMLMLMGLQGLCNGGITTAATSLVGVGAKRGTHGTAFGFAGAVTSMAWSVGPLAGGTVAALAGLRAVFVFIACVYLFIGVAAAKMYNASMTQDERQVEPDVVRE